MLQHPLFYTPYFILSIHSRRTRIKGIRRGLTRDGTPIEGSSRVIPFGVEMNHRLLPNRPGMLAFASLLL